MAKSKSKASRRKKVTPPTPHRTGVTPPKLEPKQIPNHVALVMDGNGRWAKQREQDYAKKIEERRLEQVIAERVSRNLRLDLDKGRHIDLEC